MNNNSKSGFTLVELAIVLVIIGLIIGGVLVGQDLIKAATIRATVTDIEKYNAAATTFRGKYNGLPGDLVVSKAAQFGFSAVGDANSDGLLGKRDGSGSIQSDTGSTGLGGETALFWQDLGKSALIGGNYPGIGTAAFPAAALNTQALLAPYLPHAKLRDSALFHIYSAAGRNYFYLGGISAVAGAAGGAITATNQVTPLEAIGIDEKLDDGAPATGVVVVIPSASAPADPLVITTGAAPGPTICVDNTNAAALVYNVSTAATGAPSNPVCQLSIRTSF